MRARKTDKTSVTRHCLVVMLMLLTAANLLAAPGHDAFARLDSLIAVQPRIVAQKEARLEQMKRDLGKMKSASQRYEAMRQLYEEYAAYKYDSAYSCVSECVRLAQAMGDRGLLNESYLNLAHILSTACLMDKAQQVLAQIDTTMLSTQQLVQYHRTRTDLLIYQAEYMQGTRYADEYVLR